MKLGICQIVVAPGRAEPADQAEIKMQLVFGDLVRIVEVKDNWTQVEMVKYDYTCWCDTKHFAILSQGQFDEIYNKPEVRVADITSSIRNTKNGELTHLIKGCLLPNYKDGKVSFGNQEYQFLGNTNENYELSRENIVKTALTYLNSPYLWGGNSPYGIDCSGITQMTYLLYGIQIPRDAKDQGTVGKTLSFLAEAEPGDLVYFDNSEGVITHVGILIGDGKIIHAAGHVRIDKIDHQGIYREEWGRYTHKTRIIKTLL